MWVKNCIRHRLSLMGGDSYRNALLMIKGCYPQQRWSDCVCTGGKTRLRLLADENKNADCFSAIGNGNNIYISSSQGSSPISSHVTP